MTRALSLVSLAVWACGAHAQGVQRSIVPAIDAVRPAIDSGRQLLLPDTITGTACHFWWDGIAIRETKGCSWSMAGSVPQLGRNGRLAAGAGPYAAGNRYQLGTGIDALDFTGAWWACFIFRPSDITTDQYFFSNSDHSSVGYAFRIASSSVRLVQWAPTAIQSIPANAPIVNVVNVVCGGWDGSSSLISKLNLGTIRSQAGAGAIAPATSSPARIGQTSTGALPATGSVLFEGVLVSGTPSDSVFTVIQQTVKSKLAITAWP